MSSLGPPKSLDNKHLRTRENVSNNEGLQLVPGGRSPIGGEIATDLRGDGRERRNFGQRGIEKPQISAAGMGMSTAASRCRKASPAGMGYLPSRPLPPGIGECSAQGRPISLDRWFQSWGTVPCVVWWDIRFSAPLSVFLRPTITGPCVALQRWILADPTSEKKKAWVSSRRGLWGC